ncbi:MAG: hypothetical protein WCH46_04820 [bacterium]
MNGVINSRFTLTATSITNAQSLIIEWYKNNRRRFSWRKKIRDPYEVLVCEVMAQQTQASRIEEFLPIFLKRFPTIESLAKAKSSDVIKAWQGLGYNRRALNLQKTAILIGKKKFPDTEEQLLELPGIGPYTARSVLIFAFNAHLTTIDVNVLRVLSRIFSKMQDQNAIFPREEVQRIAEVMLPPRNSRLWHEALMDFGATVCTKRNPKCSDCPLKQDCKSANLPSAKNVTKNNEPQYFGKPKRIWRGIILRTIVDHERITLKKIIRRLEIDDEDSKVKTFVKSILEELIHEGFCHKKRSTYQIQSK